MDVDGLIAAVFKKTAIWDKGSRLHSNRNVVDKCWKEISKQMNEDEIKLRKKWKYLRDQFAVEYGKIPPSGTGDPERSIKDVSKWPHFLSLLFLKDVIKPRQTNGNLKRRYKEVTEGPNDSQETSGDSQEDSQSEDDEDMSVASASPPQLRPSKKKRLASDAYDKLLDIEKQKLEYLQGKSKRRENEDEYFLFFKSLLPHVKKIPQNRQLMFRSSVQKLVQDFAYPSMSSTTRSDAKNQAVYMEEVYLEEM